MAHDCSTKGCTNVSVSAGKCNNCYSMMHYWLKKRSVAKLVRRGEQLELWQNRMDELMQGTNVRALRAKRRKRKVA